MTSPDFGEEEKKVCKLMAFALGLRVNFEMTDDHHVMVMSLKLDPLEVNVKSDIMHLGGTQC